MDKHFLSVLTCIVIIFALFTIFLVSLNGQQTRREAIKAGLQECETNTGKYIWQKQCKEGIK